MAVSELGRLTSIERTAKLVAALQELEEVTTAWLAPLLGLPAGWPGQLEQDRGDVLRALVPDDLLDVLGDLVVALVGREEVVGEERFEFGADTVHAPNSLHHATWVPRDVIIDDRGRAMEIHAFG